MFNSFIFEDVNGIVFRVRLNKDELIITLIRN